MSSHPIFSTNNPTRLNDIFGVAKHRMDSVFRALNAPPPVLEIKDDEDVFLSITLSPERLLQISTGCCEAVYGIQETIHRGFNEDHALEWLMLHELNHVVLGHFDLMDEFGIAQRSRQEVYTIDVIRYDLRHLTPLCLEMQADHEATDTLLGAYTTDGWHELREKVLAISGMMMLIELEDYKNNAEGQTHPRAATRIFQLLGHVAELPLVRAQVHHDTSLLPSEEQMHAFARNVTLPCFFDAVHLAQATGAVSITNDLGDSESFFKDLEIAKLGDTSRYSELKTQGAEEWAKLRPCNEALKPILGGHFRT